MTKKRHLSYFLLSFYFLYLGVVSIPSFSRLSTINFVILLAGTVTVVGALGLHVYNFFWRATPLFHPMMAANLKQVVHLEPKAKRGFFALIAAIFLCQFFSLFYSTVFAIFLFFAVGGLVVFFLARLQHFSQSLLVIGMTLIALAYFPIEKNDRVYSQFFYKKNGRMRINTKIVDEFEKEKLSADQANSVAWLLTVTPDEESRDYQKAVEFASLGLHKTKDKRKIQFIADTLACAYLGLEQKEKALQIVEQYQLEERRTIVEQGDLCEEPGLSRAPASVRVRKRTDYL